jgi:hypothetical protein
MKPQLAPNVAPMAGGMGLTPAATARAIITGTTEKGNWQGILLMNGEPDD